MEYKYAVALIKGSVEKIMGIFDTKEDADEFGRANTVPKDCGLQYCFASLFTKTGKPRGDMRIFNYYNSSLCNA